MSAERTSNPATRRAAIEPVSAGTDGSCADCDEHEATVVELADFRRRLDDADRERGEVLALLASLTKKLETLDGRLDTLTGNVATLSTTLVGSARTASTGGWLAGAGGLGMGIYETIKALHAAGWF